MAWPFNPSSWTGYTTITAGTTNYTEGNTSGNVISFGNTVGVVGNVASGVTGGVFFGGGTGNDFLTGGAGQDTLWGGTAGNDTLVGGAGADLFLYAGNAAGGNDVIKGFGTGADTIGLYGNGFDEPIFNSTYNLAGNIFRGTDGNAVFNFVGGNLTVNTPSVTTGITVADKNGSVETFYVANGTNGTALTGSGLGNEVLVGGAGDDTLQGSYGNDVLFGGGGNDVFVFGTGAGLDTIADYGVGSDSIKLNNVQFANLNLGSVLQRASDGSASIVLDSLDKLKVQAAGGNNSDIISLTDSTGVNKKVEFGSDNAQFAYDSTVGYYSANSAGNLTLGATNATVNLYDATKYNNVFVANGTSQTGNYTLRGSYTANDTLIGGSGNDYLWGAGGNDKLTGGTGNNSFWFGTGDGQDTIMDYVNSGAHNTIGLFSATNYATGVTYHRDAGNVEITMNGDTADTLYVRGADFGAATGNDANTVYTIGAGGSGTLASLANVGNVVVGNDAATFTYNAGVNLYVANSAGNISAVTGGDKVINLYDTTKYQGINQVAATNGNQTFRGTAGNDILTGGSGNDYLWGGAGNDQLVGGTGNNSFWFGANDGVDTIMDYGNTASSAGVHNTIGLYSAANYATGVNYHRDSGNLEITWGTDTADKLYVNGGNETTVYTIGTGGVGTLASINSVGNVAVGTDAATFTYSTGTNLYVANSAGTVNVASGDQTINLYDSTKFQGVSTAAAVNGAGNETFRGTYYGNDTLTGGAGADYLWGAGGNDQLTGGAGNNSFWFGTNDGVDTITDYGITGSSDTIGLYSATDYAAGVHYYQDGGNVEITMGNDTTDTLYVKNIASTTSDSIYNIGIGGDGSLAGLKATAKVKVGGDGASFTYDPSVNLYVANSAGTLTDSNAASATINLWDTSKYQNIHNVTYSGTGNAELRGTSGDDTITGGVGSDYIWGGAGNDVLKGGGGADTFWFGYGDGNDTIQGQANNYLDTVVLYSSSLSTASLQDTVTASGDLVIGLLNSSTGSVSDTLTIQNWANSNTGYKIDKIGIGGDGSGKSSGVTNYYHVNADGSIGAKY